MRRYQTLVGIVTVLGLPAWAGLAPASEPAAREQLIWNECADPHVQIQPAVQQGLDDGCLLHLIGSINPAQDGVSSLLSSGLFSFFPNKPGWPLRMPNQFAVSFALAELGDPSGLATIFHQIDGTVHALAPDRQSLWNQRVLLSPTSTSTTPAVADLNGDGRQEILIGVVDLFALSDTGSVLPGWPLDLPPDEGFQSLTPIITRFTPDGPLRVVASSVARLVGSIHVLDTEGNAMPGWPVTLPAFFRSVARVAVGDVTGDGIANVVALDIGNGRLFVYDHLGQLLAPFPVSTGGNSFLSAPTLGDLDGDGAAEIVFRRGFRINAIKGDGTPLPGWPQSMVAGGNFGVALGDVDGDGDLEVSGSTVNFTNDFSGGVYLWNGDGTLLPGWPKFVPDTSFAAPTIIGDVDGDGQGDLIASGLANFLSDGVIYAWKSSGELIPGFPILLNSRRIVFSAPVVADMDRDGFADLGVMSEGIRPTAFIEWFDLGVPYRPEGMEWPAEGHDMARTGAYSPPVDRRPAQVNLSPGVLQSRTPAAPLTAVVTLPVDAIHVPDVLRLVEIDGVPLPVVVKALRLGGNPKGGHPANQVIFKFDGRAVRDLLGGPGTHRLLFHSDVLSDRVMYEAEANLTLN